MNLTGFSEFERRLFSTAPEQGGPGQAIKKTFSRRRVWKMMGNGSAGQKTGDAANAAKASDTMWARIVESFRYPMQIIGRVRISTVALEYFA
jgi:hypothetical protein